MSTTPQGLGKNQIFTHHGDRYSSSNTISLYDQTFNKRHSVGPRMWDGKRLAWLPEASDHPMEGRLYVCLSVHMSICSCWHFFLGEGTKFGLKEHLEVWRNIQCMSPQRSWWGLVLAETRPAHWVTRKVTSSPRSCLGSCGSLIVSCHIKLVYYTII